MPTGLLFECDEYVGRWLYESYLKKPVYKFDRAIGLVDEKGMLIGAIIYHNWNGPNVELSYYGESTMTVGIVRAIARFTLQAFDPARLTVITSKRRKHFMRGLQKLGFRLEGIQRCFYGKVDCNRNTGVRFVAFREEIERVANLRETTSKCL